MSFNQSLRDYDADAVIASIEFKFMSVELQQCLWEQWFVHACINNKLTLLHRVIANALLPLKNFKFGLRNACHCNNHDIVFVLLQSRLRLQRVNFPYFRNDENVLRLLERGITRHQLAKVSSNTLFAHLTTLFQKLDHTNEIISSEILDVLPCRDLVPLCTQYICF